MSITPEVPPLFPGLTWNAVVKEQIIFRTKANALITQEGSRVDAKTVPVCPVDFLSYYRDELLKSGWKETWSADGGSCGSFPYGENFGYEKMGTYFQFGVIQRNGQYISFVEYSTTSETLDWKTYRNEKYGFEVKYPSDWAIVIDKDCEKNPFAHPCLGNLQYIALKPTEWTNSSQYKYIIGLDYPLQITINSDSFDKVAKLSGALVKDARGRWQTTTMKGYVGEAWEISSESWWGVRASTTVGVVPLKIDGDPDFGKMVPSPALRAVIRGKSGGLVVAMEVLPATDSKLLDQILSTLKFTK